MAKKRLRYAYDAVGNRLLLVDPDGGRFTYAYDSLNRISHLENPQNERTSYAYDDNGRRTVKKLANGTRASFSYEDASNLTRLANLKSNGTTISSFDYAYDKTGNRTAVLEADGSRVTWSYDNTYQLTGEHRTGSNAYRSTFTYDPAGNRTLKNESGQRTTYAYDAANQLETAKDTSGITSYTFDADGNQQIVQPPAGARTTTVWDYENRTTLVQLPGGVRNTMAYAPDGLRIKLEESDGTKKFVWDDQNYLAELDDSDVTQVVYSNEPAHYGNLVSQRRGSTTHWYHFDAIGSTRELTLASEAVSDTYLYDAWGVPIASNEVTPNPFQYVGKLGYYFDIDTANNYVRARLYRPVLSRWTRVDPLFIESNSSIELTSIELQTTCLETSLWRIIAVLSPRFPQGHEYHYGANNPVRRTDPLGLSPECDIPEYRCGGKFPGAGTGNISGDYCSFFGWLRGQCCTDRQIEISRCCCSHRNKCLVQCSYLTSWYFRGMFVFSCEECDGVCCVYDCGACGKAEIGAEFVADCEDTLPIEFPGHIVPDCTFERQYRGSCDGRGLN